MFRSIMNSFLTLRRPCARLWAIVAAILVAFALPAAAQTTYQSEQSKAEFVLDRTAVAPGETLLVHGGTSGIGS